MFSSRLLLKSGGCLLAALCVVSLTGCGVTEFLVGDPQEKEYKAAQALPPLEVPPDLTGVQSDEALRIPGRDEVSATGAAYPRTQALESDRFAASEVAEPVRLESSDGGNTRLTLAQDFPRAWREVGLALDGAEIDVGDRDRTRGIYFVDYPVVPQEKKGIVSRLKFWGGDEPKLTRLLVVISELRPDASQVAVFDEEEQLVTSEVARELLEKIRGQLN